MGLTLDESVLWKVIYFAAYAVIDLRMHLLEAQVNHDGTWYRERLRSTVQIFARRQKLFQDLLKQVDLKLKLLSSKKLKLLQVKNGSRLFVAWMYWMPSTGSGNKPG